ncbi:MAG: GTPase HflX [Candidatus Xenobia bacterium]
MLGLKPSLRNRIEKLYQRRLRPDAVITPELARSLTEISHEMGRQLGILVDRRGNMEAVIVGDAKSIMISEMGRYRVGSTRFRGLRFIHTRLDDGPLTQDDLTDLALLRFDLMVSVEALATGLPGRVHAAHLLPGDHGKLWQDMEARNVHQLSEIDFQEFIEALEDEFAAAARTRTVGGERRRAILVGVTTASLEDAKASMEELRLLAESAGIEVLDTVLQRRSHVDVRTLVGPGKMKEIFIRCLQLGADMLVFDRELSGSQVRAVAEGTDLEVIDRTQLILDIFARRAHSREGKIQVELAQLKYSLPRLVLKDDFLSRITGGIGLKGPGETKVEVLQRRIRDRIAALERDITALSRGRDERRKARQKAGTPVVSIVGYTNAGKSTLFNALTNSHVFVENRLFATLDPTTRRLRFPEAPERPGTPGGLLGSISGPQTAEPPGRPGRFTESHEIILADTVGFLQDLPEDLVAAFRATLEELREGTLLLHVVDVSNPDFQDQILAVEDILSDLALDAIPTLLVFNKCDLVDAARVAEVAENHPGAVFVSALDRDSLPRLTDAIAVQLWSERRELARVED